MTRNDDRSGTPTGRPATGKGARQGTAGTGPATPDSGGKDERTARLEQALRANLRRRKAQSRARADAEPPAKDAADPE